MNEEQIKWPLIWFIQYYYIAFDKFSLVQLQQILLTSCDDANLFKKPSGFLTMNDVVNHHDIVRVMSYTHIQYEKINVTFTNVRIRKMKNDTVVNLKYGSKRRQKHIFLYDALMLKHKFRNLVESLRCENNYMLVFTSLSS